MTGIDERDKSIFDKEDETRFYFNQEIEFLRAEHQEKIINCLFIINEILLKARPSA